MLKQTITYFDNPRNSADFLVARLNQNPSQLQELLGMNLCLVVIIVVNILSCSVVTLATGWKFGLVAVFGCLPPICAAGGVRMRLENTFERKNCQLYLESPNFAAEYIASIRTVLSLCLERTLLAEYKILHEKPLRDARRVAGSSMLLLALVESLELCGMALAFWYGGTLLANREYTIAQFFTIFAAAVFGGQATSVLFGFSSSFTKARSAANQIIHLNSNNGQPSISRPEGEVTVAERESDAVTFRDVSFQYPTRPDVKVLRSFAAKKSHWWEHQVVESQRYSLFLKDFMILLQERSA
jgi:ATP-binding cassette subfamily B (MDR/TAP) protein 1